jgi:hypothetical protein
MANSPLLTVAETVTGPPEAYNVTVSVRLLPITTFPKFIEVRLTLRCPGRKALPVSPMRRLESEAFDSTARVPLDSPLTVGE